MEGDYFRPLTTRDLHNPPFPDDSSAMPATHQQPVFVPSRGPFIAPSHQVLADDPFVVPGGPSLISWATEEDKERARKSKVAQKMLLESHRMGTIILDPDQHLHKGKDINRDTTAGVPTRKNQAAWTPSTDAEFYTLLNRQRMRHQPTSTNASTIASSSHWHMHNPSLGSAIEISPGEGFSRQDKSTKLPDTSFPAGPDPTGDINDTYREPVDALASLRPGRFSPRDFRECPLQSEQGPFSQEAGWKVDYDSEEEEMRLLAALAADEGRFEMKG